MKQLSCEACSWCGDDDPETPLVSGPNDLFICPDCIQVCVNALGKTMTDPNDHATGILHRRILWRLPRPGEDPIPFLAAFFDSHGTVSISRQTRRRVNAAGQNVVNHSFGIDFRISTTHNRDILELFVRHIGGCINCIKRSNGKSSTFQWAMQGRKEVVAAMNAFQPYAVDQAPFYKLLRAFLLHRDQVAYTSRDTTAELAAYREQMRALRRVAPKWKRVVAPEFNETGNRSLA